MKGRDIHGNTAASDTLTRNKAKPLSLSFSLSLTFSLSLSLPSPTMANISQDPWRRTRLHRSPWKRWPRSQPSRHAGIRGELSFSTREKRESRRRMARDQSTTACFQVCQSNHEINNPQVEGLQRSPIEGRLQRGSGHP